MNHPRNYARPTLLVTGVLAASLLSNAAAQASELDSHVGVDFGFNTRTQNGQDLTIWAPNFEAYATFNDDFALSVDWGLTSLDADQGTGVQALNPFIGLHLTPDTIDGVRMRVGLGVALPVAVSDRPAQMEALRSAQAIRGSWDSWLYQPETLSFALPLRLEWNVIEVLTLAAEGAVFVNLATTDDGQELFGVQGAVEGIGHLGIFDLGLRLQAVRPEEDAAQISAEPFVGLRFGPVGVSGRLTFNVNEPDGFTVDEGRIWGAHVGAAFYF